MQEEQDTVDDRQRNMGCLPLLIALIGIWAAIYALLTLIFKI